MAKKEKKIKIKIEDDDKTYLGEGMMYGVTAGMLLGNVILVFIGYDKIYYLPLCVSFGMCIGLAIGASIKKDNKSNKNK